MIKDITNLQKSSAVDDRTEQLKIQFDNELKLLYFSFICIVFLLDKSPVVGAVV